MNIGEMWKKISIDRYVLQQTIRTFVTGMVAIVLAHYVPSSQNGWLILSAVLLVQIRVGDLIEQQLVAQLLAGAIAAILVVLASCIGHDSFYLALLLSATSFLSVYLGFRRVQLFLPAFLVNLQVMISGGMAVNLTRSIARADFVLYGLVLAIIFTLLLWPNRLKFKYALAINKCLAASLQLLRVVFAIYLQKDYAEKHFYYEKRIYYLSRLFSYWMIILRKLSQYEQNDGVKVAQLERIFEIINGLGALRYRVKDHATWGMVNQELHAILAAFENKFNGVVQQDHTEARIDRFDEVYNSVLQVAAQEPVVYLFFVWGLRALNEELNLCFSKA